MLRLSHSQLKVFHGCKRQYYYSYVMKYKPKDQETKWLNFGSAMHEVLEEFYNKTNTDYENNIKDKWNKYKLEGRMSFDSFQEHVRNGINLYLNVTDVEKEFFLSVDNFNFVMYLDILNTEEDHILDWKSGTYTKTKEDEYKKQVICYAYGYYQKYKKLPTKLSIFFNKNNKIIDFIVGQDITEEDIFSYEKYIIESGKQIELMKQNLDENSWQQNTQNCFFCGYKHLCFNTDKLNYRIDILGSSCVLSGDVTPMLIKGITKSTRIDLPNKHFIQKAVQHKNHGLKPKNFDDIGSLFLFNKYSKKFNVGMIERIKDLLIQYSEYLKKPLKIDVVDNRDKKIIEYKLGTMKKQLINIPELRKYQQDAVSKFLSSNGMGYLEIGTGGGKTLITAEIIRQLDKKTLWIVDRKELLYQTKEVFEKTLGVECGIIGDGCFDLKDVTLATIQTLASRVDEKEYLHYNKLKNFLNNISFVIVDEAHHAAANSYVKVMSYLKNAKYRLGTTATAMRDDGLQDVMFSLIGDVIYRKTIDELTHEGYLAKGHCLFYYVPRENVEQQPTYSDDYQNNIVDYEPRNNMILDIVENYLDKKVLILVKRVEHGEYLQSKIKDSVYIHGSLNSNTRKEYMKEFKENKTGILIATLSIASEGLDIPDLEIIINASGNKANNKSIQTIGRVLRLTETKKTGYYIDFVDVGRWTRKHSNQRIEIMKNEGHKIDFK